MTATDELRKMLDERGVEWDADDEVMDDGSISQVTYWYSNGIEWSTDGRDEFLAFDAVQLITPAQAIAATLGSEECHYIPDDAGFTWWDENDVEHCEEYSASYECGSASCDKCGYMMMVGDEGWFDGWDEITEWWEEDGSYHKGYVIRPRFKHCPNCGRKVVGA